MGSPRKRARTKVPPSHSPPDTGLPEEETSSVSVEPSTSAASKSSDVKDTDGTVPVLMTKTESSAIKQLKPRNSWSGTWPRKSIASTQVARESILAENPANGALTTDLGRFEPKMSPAMKPTRPPSMRLGKSRETLDIALSEPTEEQGGSKTEPMANQSSTGNTVPQDENTKPSSEQPSTRPQLNPSPEGIAQRPATSSGWFGNWIGGKPTTQYTPVPDEPSHSEDPPPTSLPEPEPQKEPEVQSEQVLPPAQSSASSWFGLWSSTTQVPTTIPEEQIPVKLAENGTDMIMEDAPALDQAPTSSSQPSAGSSWAFWSTDTSKRKLESPSKVDNPGELAITGEASEVKPEPAKAVPSKNNKKSKFNKRAKTQPVEVEEVPQKAAQVDSTSSKASSSKTLTPAKASPPNLLLPSVKSTYRLVENPSILAQIARILFHGKQDPVKHVSLVKDKPKIRKALAIGIHGLFPAPLLRTVIGQPTGTSIRFANHAAASIRRWADKNGCSDCEIDKVALEGEGKIDERVDNLWKLLINWVTHVKNADFILVACHSQGVPVALMLIAKLIEFGVASTGRIGVCAMAGVSLGPFPDYKSRLFSGSAGELFDFANPESAVSKRYEESLRVALKYGVRVTYCGSIDDQLVSMESSIFSIAEHPYIYRAVFVDGRIHAPDFLSHLVGFALKLRNLGVSDHGLIRELSAPLAGSLYTGEGHSRLYDDENVYDLAVEFGLETTSVGDVPLNIKKYEILMNPNPYVLPWIMRGLLEESFVKTELDHETTELLKQFDDWKPSSKVLKDVKYRLEAVRSKL